MNRKVLARVLPLLLVAGGVFFWRGGFGVFTAERELIWRVPGPYSSVRSVEVQVYDGEELLKREEWKLPNGLQLDPTDKMQLKDGTYQTNLIIGRDGVAQPEAYRIPVRIEGKGPFVIAPK